MPLMKRAGAPIESLFRSTYDLFINNHREGVWDPSSFDEENDLTIYTHREGVWDPSFFAGNRGAATASLRQFKFLFLLIPGALPHCRGVLRRTERATAREREKTRT